MRRFDAYRKRHYDDHAHRSRKDDANDVVNKKNSLQLKRRALLLHDKDENGHNEQVSSHSRQNLVGKVELCIR
jgi:hypothetical protein